MKKKSESRVLKVITSIFSIRRWFDWDRMKSFTAFIITGLRRLFLLTQESPDIGKKKESDVAHNKSFLKAQKKLNLTDEDLLQREKALFRLSVLMSFLTICFLSYTFYHLFQTSFQATLLSFVVTLISAALAFRYHFWYYQIKNRKLGCSFHEWFKKGLLGEKK